MSNVIQFRHPAPKRTLSAECLTIFEAVFEHTHQGEALSLKRRRQLIAATFKSWRKRIADEAAE
jgi:hypothetical protein